MKFVLDREKQEAERRTIEALGIRDAWAIIAQGLTPSIMTPSIISYQSIEAFRELARSPNAKVIVTDGKSPLLHSAQAAIEAPSVRTSQPSTETTLSAPQVQLPTSRRAVTPPR